MTNVCCHGQLARSCELCDRDKEIAELKVEIELLKRDVKEWRKIAFKLKELANYIT